VQCLQWEGLTHDCPQYGKRKEDLHPHGAYPAQNLHMTHASPAELPA